MRNTDDATIVATMIGPSRMRLVIEADILSPPRRMLQDYGDMTIFTVLQHKNGDCWCGLFLGDSVCDDDEVKAIGYLRIPEEILIDA